MATIHIYTIKGISPVSEAVMEVEIVADSPEHAKKLAEDTGMRMVMVVGVQDCASSEHEPEAPG